MHLAHAVPVGRRPAGWPVRLWALMLAAPAWAAPVAIHVAPGGSDTATGTPAEPFASLTRARDELRALRRAGKLGEGATVNVAAGTWRLQQPLTFGADDSGTPAGPIVWRGAGQRRTRLVGDWPVTGFQPFRNGIMVADLKDTPLAKVAFRQLFCRGERQVLARYPNVDPQDPHGGRWAHIAASDPAPATNNSVSDNVPQVKDHFTATRDVIKPTWQHVQRAEIGIHPAYGWAWNVVRLKSADAATGVIALARNVSYGLVVGDRYFVQNLLAELDAPGEWYLDPDQAKLYFLPPAELGAGEVGAPVCGTLIAATGAAHLTWRGFALENCDATAVELKNCDSVRVAGCTIRNTGAWGVNIVGGHRSGVSGCDLWATGAGGVALTGGNRQTLERGDLYADNNYIHHIAAFDRTYKTGVNLAGVGNFARHNLIHDCYHQGILVGGNDQTVEYNVVHHTNLGSEDTGGLYMSSRDFTQRGTVIRYNLFHHLGGFGKASSWRPVAGGKVKFIYPAFTWGIYLDAPESGVTVLGNLLYAVPVCGLFNHEGRDNTWANNVIIDAPGFQVSGGGYPDLMEQSYSYVKRRRADGSYAAYLQRYPELATYTDDPASFSTVGGSKFQRNIIYYTPDGGRMMRERHRAQWGGGQLVWSWRGHKADFPRFEFDHNCVWGPAGLDLKFRLDLLPDAGRLLSWAEWRATGHDAHSLNADPRFVDPARHDYHLQPDSPVRALGFKDLPLEQMGPQADELRASWPIVEAKGAAALGEFTTERYFDVPGHEPVPAKELQVRGGLPNVKRKLAAGQPLTVVCFAGGNHAQGGWFDSYLKQLRAQHPGVTITGHLAAIDGGARGSGFSVYRFAHEALRHKPDLVLIDFASDDAEAAPEAAQAAIEGMIRQAWHADPSVDMLLVYSFRVGYEQDLDKGLCPSVVSAFERLAERYGLPAVNLGQRFWTMQRDGRLVYRAKPDEVAKLTGKVVFTTDGVYTSPAAFNLSGQVMAEGTSQLLAAPTAPFDRAAALGRPLRPDHLAAARQVPITEAMLTGRWSRQPAGAFGQHFEQIWFTDQPGAKLTFRFKGTAASLFDLMGPDTGRVRVTVDGRDVGVRQQVDRWSYYQRLSSLGLAGAVPDREHTVTVELLADPPDRAEPIAEAKRLGRYEAKAFDGVALRLGWIRMVGEPLP